MLIFKEKTLKEKELCHVPRGNIYSNPLKEKAWLGTTKQSDQDKKKNKNMSGHTAQKRQETRAKDHFLPLENKQKSIFQRMVFVHDFSEEYTKYKLDLFGASPTQTSIEKTLFC